MILLDSLDVRHVKKHKLKNQYICFFEVVLRVLIVSCAVLKWYCYRGQDGSIKRSRAQVSCSSVENFMPRSSVYGSDSKNTKAPFTFGCFQISLSVFVVMPQKWLP